MEKWLIHLQLPMVKSVIYIYTFLIQNFVTCFYLHYPVLSTPFNQPVLYFQTLKSVTSYSCQPFVEITSLRSSLSPYAQLIMVPVMSQASLFMTATCSAKVFGSKPFLFIMFSPPSFITFVPFNPPYCWWPTMQGFLMCRCSPEYWETTGSWGSSSMWYLRSWIPSRLVRLSSLKQWVIHWRIWSGIF